MSKQTTTISPYRVTLYEIRTARGLAEQGIAAIFENHPNKLFPLSIPDDPRPLELTSYSLASSPTYRLRVRGGYASPLEICRGDLAIRALEQLGYLIDHGIADMPAGGRDD